jgi:hypothetical protein
MRTMIALTLLAAMATAMTPGEFGKRVDAVMRKRDSNTRGGR